MSSTAPAQPGIVPRLSLMMFIQFFVWGSWFMTLGPCLGANGFGDAIAGGAYGSAPIAAMIAPLFLGLIADRFFPSEKVMGVLMLIGGGVMCAVPSVAASGDGNLLVWLFIIHMLCYMPTLGLSNTIAFSNIPSQNDFPKIRVWGTIGWIVAGLVSGFMGWSLSLNLFWLAGIMSLVFGVYSFTLPHTPPPAKGKPLDIRSIFMLDAFTLFRSPPFAVFMICSGLICIPLAYYYGITSYYLNDTGFVQPISSMTLGQMSEIIFMILIPFFLRRLGIKWMILIGMLAWVVRYGLFAVAAPNQVAWMIFLAIILHGICYDFFFVTGFIYADKKAPKEIRGQTQSLLVFFTQGVGMYFGYWIAYDQLGKTLTDRGELATQIADARNLDTLTYLESMQKMFSVEMPQVDPELLATVMQQWQTFWWLPAGMAGVIAVIFFLGFWDREVESDVTESEQAEAAEGEAQTAP